MFMRYLGGGVGHSRPEETADITGTPRPPRVPIHASLIPPKENLQATVLEIATGEGSGGEDEESDTSSDNSGDDPNDEDYKD
jgi:hypothetical protein